MTQIEVCPGTMSRATSESTTTTASDTSQYIAGLHRRRSVTLRVPPYGDCPCRDPWVCRCGDYTELSEAYVDGYRDAARHLLAQGLLPAPNVPAMRVMWGRRGADQRLARTLAESWQVVA